MSDNSNESSGPQHRSVEIGVALLMAVFAAIVIAGSIQVGIGWGAEGPKAGFFPFYVGLTILGSSIINLGATVSERGDRRLFAEWGQLGQVMSMLVRAWTRRLAESRRKIARIRSRGVVAGDRRAFRQRSDSGGCDPFRGLW